MTARVLIVDDVPANARLLEARLRAEYFEVGTAWSGAACLRIATEGRGDLVLLDVLMPDMSGFEAFAAQALDIGVNDDVIRPVYVNASGFHNGAGRRQRRGADPPRRPGPLRGQTVRPQPRGGKRRVTGALQRGSKFATVLTK